VRKVTIISAPAGSGKTSLLRAWADRPGQPYRLAVAAIQRDQHDAQLFWLALLDAVRHATGATSGTQRPAATPDFNARVIADRVLAELADAHGDIMLVIDDLHELNSPESLAELTRLLENLPPHAHAVLATRRDLRLRLHRLRLAGELTEIRAADLRFTEHETRELLGASGVVLSEAGTALLHRRTEGWAAGLRLAAIALADHPDRERFVEEFSGSDRMVAEYLIAEMLEHQPAEVQQLLLRTSLLDRVNGELADLLTGRSGSEWILLELEDANAFVVSLDAERTWFRYHHLFGDLLRLEARRVLPEERPGLHRRAAAWFTQHGYVVEGRLDEAAAHLAVAERHVETTPPDRQRRLRVAIGALKLSLARRRGHLAGVLEQVQFLASPVTGQSDEDIALGSDLRAVALMNLGAVEAWSLGLPEAERHLQQGADLARSIGRPYLEVSCLAQLGFASKVRPFATTQRRCQEAITLAERHGWGAEPMIGPALVTLAGTMIWTGEFDEGERWLHRAAAALQADTGPDITLLVHHTTGILHAARGRYAEALEEFSTAEHLRSQLEGSHALASQVTSWMLATQARLGMPGAARTALAALDDEQAGSAEIRNAHAVICLAEGNPAAALTAAQDVLDAVAPAIGYVTIVEAHLLAGLAHRELGDQRAANLAAERALALAEADRLVLPFAITGAAQLLEALPRHETAHAALLTDILDVVHGSSLTAKGQASPPHTEKLSPGELRVLRYLPTNLSRPEIASELSVSVNTVNTHVRSIYAKLRAGDRSSAVQRARELRLLSAGLTR
jgi:LuxR family transcriptional regulator, maltose regulon positive regulatory protein